MIRRGFLCSIVLLGLGLGCRGSSETGTPVNPVPPIIEDPAPDQIEMLITILRAAAEKARTESPEIAPWYPSACPGTAKKMLNVGCFNGWCVDVYRTACGEWYLRLSGPDGDTWFYNGLPARSPM